MVPVLTVIIIITISILITKVATIALMHTGLSRQSARFQATNAFTGVGYTTNEAENLVNHPLRRKIILLLMLLGNAGIVSVMASLLLTFVGPEEEDLALWIRLLILGAGIALLLVFFNSRIVNRGLSRIIHYGLQKYTRLDVQDYSGLLHLSGDYEISEIFIEEDDWLAEKRLAELALPREGLFILGINRKNGTYLGVPGHHTQICPGDTLIIYGRASAIKRINNRKKGTMAEFERRLSEKENRLVRKEEQKKDRGDQKAVKKEDVPE